MRLWLLLLGLVMAAPQASNTKTVTPPPTSSMPGTRPPDPVVGETLWRQSCWQCHGEVGKGDGPAAASLIGGVPSLEGSIKEPEFDALITTILAGKGKMPAYAETIERPDVRRILIYLNDRMMGKPPPSAAPESPDAPVKPEGQEGPPAAEPAPER
jgi:mono/diheme cytochrome c family protein